MFVLVLFAFVGASIAAFYSATHPPRIDIPYTPATLDLPAEHVTLETEDGVKIAGWHIPSPQAPERALLLLHGYPANKADLLPLASDLYPDFSILLIDFRYFGESGGSATTLGIHEQRDVAAALTFLDERYERIGIFGYSYGGAVALQKAAADEHVDAVATFSAFANLRALARETYSFLWVFKYPFVELMNLYARVTFGTWASSVAPAKHAANITAPVFIGHSEGDSTVSVSHARTLITALQSAGKDPQTHIVPGGTHMGLPLDIGEQLRRFFDQQL